MVQTDNIQSHWFSLSKYILWFFYNFYEEIVKENFNTSHVTLYRHIFVYVCDIPEFQYITCYSLSCGWNDCQWSCEVSIHHMLLFILYSTPKINLVKLFQYITCYSLSDWIYLVYCSVNVSIHHMLLFINGDFGEIRTILMFQYITCYSLSRTDMYQKRTVYWFQYITCYSLSHRVR